MPALLSLIGVTKRYLRGVREVVVLDGASLDLQAGDFACVLGGASDGKTTLLEVAAGLQPPDSGRVLFDGRDLAQLNDTEHTRLRRSEIACVLNRSAPVLAKNALDHVAMPLLSDGWGRKRAKRAAAEMLERVGVGGEAEAPVHSLSGAERARVALANACVRSPRLLLADELTDTLNMAERNAVLGILQGFARDGVAILLTAADPFGAVGCDRLLSLSRGRLIEAEAGPADAPVPTPNHGEVVPLHARGGDGARE
jgi:putative ABC transport system ATP-binding protein